MGIVKGTVVSQSGSPVSGISVTGWLSGPLGGAVSVMTGLDGRFVLTYQGSGELEYVSASGGERVEHVKSGSNVTLYRG